MEPGLFSGMAAGCLNFTPNFLACAACHSCERAILYREQEDLLKNCFGQGIIIVDILRKSETWFGKLVPWMISHNFYDTLIFLHNEKYIWIKSINCTASWLGKSLVAISECLSLSLFVLGVSKTAITQLKATQYIPF